MKDVELAGLLQDLRHHAGHALRVQEVDHHRDRLRAEAGAEVLQLLLGIVDQRDAGAGRHECPGAFEADARRGARDGRDFARQILTHL